MRQAITLFLLILFPLNSLAEVPAWDMDLEASSLDFIAEEKGVPVEGRFDKFSAWINFDKNNLDKSAVTIEVDMLSVSADYKVVSDELKKNHWFNVGKFPKAVFKSKSFKSLEDGSYEVSGTLNLKGYDGLVILPFTLKEEDDVITVTGRTIIKRTEYRIGQGEWSNTKVVSDDVKLDVKVVAKLSQTN